MKARRGSVVPGSVGLFLLCAALFAENVVIAIGRDDDTTFGILHSRFHEVWSLPQGHLARQGQRPALHPDHDLRDLPIPGRALARHLRDRLRHGSTSAGHRFGGPAAALDIPCLEIVSQ